MAAERDLMATLDRAYELVLLPVAREGLEGPYGFEEIDLSARMGLGRNVHDRVLEGLSNHVFESITPTKLSTLLGLGDSDGARPFVSCEEVVAAAFSYLQFPKLRSDAPLRDAIAAGDEGDVRLCVDGQRRGRNTLSCSRASLDRPADRPR